MARAHKDFVEACADAVKDSAIPLPFRYWSAISAVSGALGRRCWYDAGAFKIYPNMFVLLVAGPGRGKSVSFSLPFGQVFKALTTPIGTTPQSDEFNPMLFSYGLEDRPLYLVEDRITPEKLAVDMARVSRTDLRLTGPTTGTFWDSSLTMATSEFGTFMNRNDVYLQMFMTDMWDSKDQFSYRTKTAGEYMIKGPCLNWIACATPDQLVDNLPENARSQGLLSRMFIVYYDGEKLPADIWYGKASTNEVDNLRADFAEIAQMHGPFTLEDKLKDTARDDVRAGLQPEPSDPNLGEYSQRRPSHLFKIAMAVSASRSDKRIITEADWRDARWLMSEAEAQMPKALERFGVGKAGKIVSELKVHLADLKLHKKVITTNKLRQEILRRVSSPVEVEATVQSMERSGLIRIDGKQVFLQ